MALVAYDYDSNASEEDEEEENTDSQVIITKSTDPKPPLKTSENETKESNTSMFTVLPKTKQSSKTIQEDQIEDFVPKSENLKEKQKVKITIPSLSEFAGLDKDAPASSSKKVKPSAKGSGLISLLPPVKVSPISNTSFIPNSLQRKPINKPTVKSVTMVEPIKSEIAKKIPSKYLKEASASSSNVDESDDEMEMPETFDDDMWQKVCGRQVKPIRQEIPQPEITFNIAPEPEKPYDGLDNIAFKELVGKTKRPIGNIRLIDLNEEEILPEKDLWMSQTRSLTDPELAPKKVVEDPVDPTRKRKHHITYLAEQAKANEQELANTWASSKFSRNQSRAKYGF